MNTPTKLGGYALGLLAVFGAAAGIGAAVGPVGLASAEMPHSSGDSGSGSPPDAGTHGDPTAPAPTDEHTAGRHGGPDPSPPDRETPGGLMVSQQGYSLALDEPALPAGSQVPMSFRVLGPDGTPVTTYEPKHGKDLHLIAVRRDMTGFQHVHPTLGADGTWDVPLDLSAPGEYRIFAAFTPAGAGPDVTFHVPTASEERP